MVLDIVTYGGEALRRPSVRVEEITDSLKELARDMLDTMYDAEGVGLAAEQVGRTEAVCVIDVPASCEKNPADAEFNKAIEMPLVMVNGKITASSGSNRAMEGCLSFPDIHAQITRAQEVTFEYTGLDGLRRKATARGLLARAVQHELDHLEGKLMIDRFSAVQKLSVAGKLRKLAAE